MGKEEIRKKLAEIFTGYLLEIHQIVQVSDVPGLSASRVFCRALPTSEVLFAMTEESRWRPALI